MTTNNPLNEVITITRGEMYNAFNTVDAEAYSRGYHDGRHVRNKELRKAETRGVWRGGFAAITGMLIGMVGYEVVNAYVESVKRKAADVDPVLRGVIIEKRYGGAENEKSKEADSVSDVVKEVVDVVQD